MAAEDLDLGSATVILSLPTEGPHYRAIQWEITSARCTGTHLQSSILGRLREVDNKFEASLGI